MFVHRCNQSDVPFYMQPSIRNMKMTMHVACHRKCTMCFKCVDEFGRLSVSTRNARDNSLIGNVYITRSCGMGSGGIKAFTTNQSTINNIDGKNDNVPNVSEIVHRIFAPQSLLLLCPQSNTEYSEIVMYWTLWRFANTNHKIAGRERYTHFAVCIFLSFSNEKAACTS